MTFEGRNLPPQVIQHCIDAATDKMMSSFGGNLRQDMCSKQDVQKVGNTLVVDSVCQMGGMTINSHGVITGDFSSGYTAKVTSTPQRRTVAFSNGPTTSALSASSLSPRATFSPINASSFHDWFSCTR